MEIMQSRLDMYLAAESKILTGHQSYTVSGTTFTRATLSALQGKISELEAKIATANGTGYRPQQVVFGRTR